MVVIGNCWSGCDGFEMGVVEAVAMDLWRRWCGGVVVRCWCGDVESGVTGVWLISCVIAFPRYEILWTLTNLLRFAGFFFKSLTVFKSVEVCRFLCIRLAFSRQCWPFGMQAETYQPRFLFYLFPIKFWFAELFFGLWWVVHFWFEIGN
jgi:hypothetical protein